MDILNHEFVDPLDDDALLDECFADEISEELGPASIDASEPADSDDVVDADLERAREVHLLGVSTFSRRIDDARRLRDEQLAEIEDERTKITIWFHSEMERLDAETDTVRTKAKKSIAASARLLRISRAALEVALS
jgi:hypothetical protein